MNSHNRQYFFRLIQVFCLSFFLAACSTTSNEDTSYLDYRAMNAERLSQEEGKEFLNEVGKNWWYGNGVGETIVDVSLAVVFPPYIIYLLGSSASSLSGYGELEPSELLPEAGQEAWQTVYGGITGVPGRINAAISGEDFRDQQEKEAALRPYLAKLQGRSAEIVPRLP